MTHNAQHVIIHKLTAPVSFSETDIPTRLKVWHLAVGLMGAGFVLGLLF